MDSSCRSAVGFVAAGLIAACGFLPHTYARFVAMPGRLPALAFWIPLPGHRRLGWIAALDCYVLLRVVRGYARLPHTHMPLPVPYDAPYCRIVYHLCRLCRTPPLPRGFTRRLPGCLPRPAQLLPACYPWVLAYATHISSPVQVLAAHAHPSQVGFPWLPCLPLPYTPYGYTLPGSWVGFPGAQVPAVAVPCRCWLPFLPGCLLVRLCCTGLRAAGLPLAHGSTLVCLVHV